MADDGAEERKVDEGVSGRLHAGKARQALALALAQRSEEALLLADGLAEVFGEFA